MLAPTRAQPPAGVTISALESVNGYKQAYGIVGFKFEPIEGRGTENACTFRFLHEWFDDDGKGNPTPHKPVPAFVAEMIFRNQMRSLRRMAGI